jgi:hypothetical protein
MAGILADLFDVRTNGNGFIRSQWDDILLKRDLERHITEGRVKEVPRVVKQQSTLPDGLERKWFRDCETGDTYEYTGYGERSGPRFNKLSFDDLCKTAPNSRPV